MSAHAISKLEVATRWSTTLSSKVKLPHRISCRALCGVNLVTQHPGIEGERSPRTPPCGVPPLDTLPTLEVE